MDFGSWQIYGQNQPIDESKVNPSVPNSSVVEASPNYEFYEPCGWANEVGIQVSNYYHSYPNAPPQFVNTIQYIDIPKFNGAGDFKVWVNQYCWVLGFQNVEDEQKIQMVSRYLEGAAIRWHNAYTAGKIKCPSWSDYVFGMNCWFDLRQTDLPMVEWIYLTQKGTLLEYYEYFARTRVRVLCSEEFVVEYFIGGLRKEYQDFVRGKLPSTVYEAYYWAYNYEKFLLSLENLDDLVKSTLASTAQNSITESSQETNTRTSELELVLKGVDEEFQNLEEKDYELGTNTRTSELELGLEDEDDEFQNLEEKDYELGLEGDQREVQAKEAIIAVQCPVEVCNLVDKEDEFLVENDQFEGQILEPVIQVGCHEEFCSKLSFSGYGFKERVGLNLSEEGMAYRVSNVGNCFDASIEFKFNNVMEFDFIGADAYIEMQQLGARKNCLRNYVKLVVMFGDGMEKVRKKCGDYDFYSLAAIFVNFSCKVLLMECGLVTKGDVEWDYKRYKKKVQEGYLHNKFCLIVLAARSLKLLLLSFNS